MFLLSYIGNTTEFFLNSCKVCMEKRGFFSLFSHGLWTKTALFLTSDESSTKTDTWKFHKYQSNDAKQKNFHVSEWITKTRIECNSLTPSLLLSLLPTMKSHKINNCWLVNFFLHSSRSVCLRFVFEFAFVGVKLAKTNSFLLESCVWNPS